MRKILLPAAVVALGAAGSAALAEPMTLSDVQMDAVTAGMDTATNGVEAGTMAAANDAGPAPGAASSDQPQGQGTLPADVISAIILGAGETVNTVITEVFQPFFTPGVLAPGSDQDPRAPFQAVDFIREFASTTLRAAIPPTAPSEDRQNIVINRPETVSTSQIGGTGFLAPDRRQGILTSVLDLRASLPSAADRQPGAATR